MSSLSKKFLARLILFFIFLIAASYLLFNENGILKYLRLKSEISELEENINNAEGRLKALEKEIDSLQTSKEKIEKVARERYHMLKPGEEILKVEEN